MHAILNIWASCFPVTSSNHHWSASLQKFKSIKCEWAGHTWLVFASFFCRGWKGSKTTWGQKGVGKKQMDRTLLLQLFSEAQHMAEGRRCEEQSEANSAVSSRANKTCPRMNLSQELSIPLDSLLSNAVWSTLHSRFLSESGIRVSLLHINTCFQKAYRTSISLGTLQTWRSLTHNVCKKRWIHKGEKNTLLDQIILASLGVQTKRRKDSRLSSAWDLHNWKVTISKANKRKINASSSNHMKNSFLGLDLGM